MKLPLQLGASRLGASRSLQQNEHLTGCPDMLLCKTSAAASRAQGASQDAAPGGAVEEKGAGLADFRRHLNAPGGTGMFYSLSREDAL